MLLPLICDFTKATTTLSSTTVATIFTTATIISGGGGVGLPKDFYPAICEAVEENNLVLAVICLEDLVYFIG